MALTTAARRSELLFLRWAMVNLKEGLALVPVTKNGEIRQLPLVPHVQTTGLEDEDALFPHGAPSASRIRSLLTGDARHVRGVCRRRLHGDHLVRSQENLSKILNFS